MIFFRIFYTLLTLLNWSKSIWLCIHYSYTQGLRPVYHDVFCLTGRIETWNVRSPSIPSYRELISSYTPPLYKSSFILSRYLTSPPVKMSSLPPSSTDERNPLYARQDFHSPLNTPTPLEGVSPYRRKLKEFTFVWTKLVSCFFVFPPTSSNFLSGPPILECLSVFLPTSSHFPSGPPNSGTYVILGTVSNIWNTTLR